MMDNITEVIIIDPRWVSGQMIFLRTEEAAALAAAISAAIDGCTNCISIDEMLSEEEAEGI